MNAIDFGSYGAAQFDTSREALLRSTLSLAVGFVLAKGLHREDMDAATGEAYRTAVKRMLRDNGEDRKTADRHVNTATRDIAPKLVPLLDMGRVEADPVADTVASLMATVRDKGVGNVSALKRLMKGDAVSDPDGEDKSPEDKAAETAAKASDADEAADSLMAAMMRRDVPVDANVAPEAEAEAAPEAEADPLAYVEDLTDADLAALAKRVRDVMTKRKRDADKAQAA